MSSSRRVLSVLVATVLVLSSTIDVVRAQEVSRSFTEQSLCEERTAGATTVRLVGDEGGEAGDVLTVCETLVPGLRTGSLEDLEIFPGQGGVAEQISSQPPLGIGVFEERALIEHPGRLAPPEATNVTIHNGGDSYTSIAETGQDIWAPGDTMEFAYSQFRGDFDVVVRIDDFDHSGGDGCWGKWGLMARQSLDSSSRMCMVANHGPKGVQQGAVGPCGGAAGQCANFFGRNNHLDPANGGPNMFENPPPVDGPVAGNGALNPECMANYLRLRRVGDTISGFISDDPAVEGDPSNDALYLHAGDFNAAGNNCYYVGFGNHDHSHAGPQVQTVEFSVVQWSGTGCLDGAGAYDGQSLIEHPGREAIGSNNDVVHNGGDSYTSIAETGRDIWAPGDTAMFAYDKFDGDFDVSVRIDGYNHSGGDGCWGKWGLMARQSLDSSSKMVAVANNGPKGVQEGATGPCGGAPGQCANFFGRNNHLDPSNGGPNMFEAPPLPDFPCMAPYLRLKRVGDTITGWVSDNAGVEGDPTNDELWRKIGPDYNAANSPSCWFVGFVNQDHEFGGAQIQTIDFTRLAAEGESCFDSGPALDSWKITWTDVTRAQVDAGLSYSIENAGDELATAEHLGEVLGESLVTGPTASYTEPGVVITEVGDLSMRTIGTGHGDATHDGATGMYSMTGGGRDIWDGGDHMNWLYKKLPGDFDVTLEIVSRSFPEGPPPFSKTGLMARESCHPDARNDLMGANPHPQGPRLFHRLDNVVPNPDTNRQAYVVEPAGTVPGSPGAGSPGGGVNPDPASNPDYYRLIRTGSQITAYIAWDLPGFGRGPAHWCLVGSRNVQDRPDDLFVGVPLDDFDADPATAASVDFFINCDEYVLEDLNLVAADEPIFAQDFNSEEAGNPPAGGHVSGAERGGGFTPEVSGGRLQMTKLGTTNSSTAVLWDDESLANILETGFQVEFDVQARHFGAAPRGDGGTFVVIASASDQIPEVVDTSVGDFDGQALVEEAPALGATNEVVHNGGDSYTSIAETGRDIWAPGDTFVYSYNRFEGDFDVSVRIDNYEHSTGDGCWGKWGLMARQTLEPRSRHCMVANNGPKGVQDGAVGPCGGDAGQCANFFGRNNHLDPANGGPNMFEAAPLGGDLCFARYLRLKRVGNAIQGWVSNDPAVEDNPTDDANWTRVGPDYNAEPGGACYYVGFANHDHNVAGTNRQTIEFTRLSWDGVSCFDNTPPPMEFHGSGGSGLGFGGEVDGGTGAANPLREGNECRPMFALEIDTHSDETPESRYLAAGLNHEGTGAYHIGLNTDSNTSSRQINEDLGILPEDLPDIFFDTVHITLVYKPNGEIAAWADGVQVIDTYIPPLSLGAGLARPVIGFTGGTSDKTQTLEFDNLTVWPLVDGNQAPTAVIATEPVSGEVSLAGGSAEVTLDASGSDDGESGDQGLTFSWEKVSGPDGDSIAAAGAAVTTVLFSSAGEYVYRVTVDDGQGSDNSTDSAEVTITVLEELEPMFLRGDANNDGVVDLSDGQFIFLFLFLGGAPPTCPDAADSNDAGDVDLSSGIYVLNFLFLGGAAPADPYPACGVDPSADALAGCAYDETMCP